MRMNKRMRPLFQSARDVIVQEGSELFASLAELVRKGLVEENGCIFLKALKDSNTHISQSSCHDKTGYEAFINHLHMEDFAQDLSTTKRRKALLSQALLMACAVDVEFRRSFPRRVVVFLIAVEEDGGCNFRFHLRRKNEQWVNGDVEEYREEAVLILESRKDIRMLCRGERTKEPGEKKGE